MLHNTAHKPLTLPHRQQGLAMLMVVSVVVLMITLLAVMLEDQHIMIRQIGNERVSEQGRHYSLGLNAWALRVLHEDENPLVDYEGERWAKFGRPKPELTEEEKERFSLDPSLAIGSEEDEDEEPTIDFGIETLTVTIDDLQGRFNLNNLRPLKKGQKPPQDQKRIFLNLLQLLEIGEFQEDRDALYWNLLDWLDENNTSANIGAESNDYQIRSVPYFASDQPLNSIGELKYVKGFTKKIIKQLRPFVSVLPVPRAKLNLNTVSPEVLASLSSGIVVDASRVEDFLALKKQSGFLGFQLSDINAAQSAVNLVSPGARSIKNMLQVNSQFFQIYTRVELGDSVVCSRTSVLRKSANPATLDDQQISVLNREYDTVCKAEQADELGEEELSSNENLP